MVEFAEINGPNGVFYIAIAGGKPELEIANQYKDAKRSFYFYTNYIDMGNSTYILDVTNITLRPFRPAVTKLGEDTDKILENIEYFLRTREIYFPSQNLAKPEFLVGVQFSWKQG